VFVTGGNKLKGVSPYSFLLSLATLKCFVAILPLVIGHMLIQDLCTQNTSCSNILEFGAPFVKHSVCIFRKCLQVYVDFVLAEFISST
jgi:hypothetical protein